jgi:hypothetical protein
MDGPAPETGRGVPVTFHDVGVPANGEHFTAPGPAPAPTPA